MRKLFIATLVAATTVIAACAPAPSAGVTVDGVTYTVDGHSSSTASDDDTVSVLVTVTATNTSANTRHLLVADLVDSNGQTHPAYPGRYVAAVLRELAPSASTTLTFDYETSTTVDAVALRFTSSGGDTVDLAL